MQGWLQMSISLFREFVHSLTDLSSRNMGESELLAASRSLLAELLRRDIWLPEDFARSDPENYKQYLLYCDPMERFSIVSFVWGAGQETPIHDHTVWGLLGVLRGAEHSQRFVLDGGELQKHGVLESLEAGDIDMVSPDVGDIHKVKNGRRHGTSVSSHVYGGNIGKIRRHAFKDNGSVTTFVSGYSLAPKVGRT
jgi:predicted metal-dependent enzyme (double-stranded beta helix superfamily)